MSLDFVSLSKLTVKFSKIVLPGLVQKLWFSAAAGNWICISATARDTGKNNDQSESHILTTFQKTGTAGEDEKVGCFS